MSEAAPSTVLAAPLSTGTLVVPGSEAAHQWVAENRKNRGHTEHLQYRIMSREGLYHWIAGGDIAQRFYEGHWIEAHTDDRGAPLTGKAYADLQRLAKVAAGYWDAGDLEIVVDEGSGARWEYLRGQTELIAGVIGLGTEDAHRVYVQRIIYHYALTS